MKSSSSKTPDRAPNAHAVPACQSCSISSSLEDSVREPRMVANIRILLVRNRKAGGWPTRSGRRGGSEGSEKRWPGRKAMLEDKTVLIAGVGKGLGTRNRRTPRFARAHGW